jgi:hypothetical protein
MGVPDLTGQREEAGRDQYHKEKRNRNPHHDKHVKLLRSTETYGPVLAIHAPSNSSKQIDPVRSVTVTLFPRVSVSNPSLVDATFPDGKGVTAYSHYRRRAANEGPRRFLT